MPRHADPNAEEALVAAARAEFARRGLRGARIEDITAACGLSKGAFYLHFESKEALFGDLVHAFQARMIACTVERDTAMHRFAEEHGAMDARDAAEHTSRYQELLALEARLDLATLEAMWDFRDVVGVLVRGCQGTPFEGTVWELVDFEVNRVRTTFEGLQGQRMCRADIPGELFGSLIVGTYLLLGVRMSRMSEKPDLAALAAQLHTLIHEGSQPGGAQLQTPIREGSSQPGGAASGAPGRGAHKGETHHDVSTALEHDEPRTPPARSKP